MLMFIIKNTSYNDSDYLSDYFFNFLLSFSFEMTMIFKESKNESLFKSSEV